MRLQGGPRKTLTTPVKQLLEIFTVGRATIHETAGLAATAQVEDVTFQIGVHSTIGKDTIIGGIEPHIFQVTIRLPRKDPKAQLRQEEISRALIDLEKPAHTKYILHIQFPTMRLQHHSTIGIDTLLGTIPEG